MCATSSPVECITCRLRRNERDKNIAVILTCLKIGRKSNLLKGKDEEQKWKGLVDLDILEKWMYHYNEDVS